MIVQPNSSNSNFNHSSHMHRKKKLASFQVPTNFNHFIYSGFYLVVFMLQIALAYAEGTDAMKVT